MQDSTSAIPPTQEQERAARHESGPACVVAGAGTGKTRTLCARIVYLIEERHLDPKRVLVTTFTRKATAELYQRAYERLGDRARSVRISTIDALVFDLAQEAANRGFMPHRRRVSQAESRVLLLESAWETSALRDRSYWADEADRFGLVGLLEDTLRLELATRIERNRLGKDIQEKLRKKREAPYLRCSEIPTLKELRAAVRHYHQNLRQLDAADYDGLFKEFVTLLRKRKSLAQHFASLFDSVLVDEFQDTSRVQSEVLLLLAGDAMDIWVVGDPCQQIYEWRGAGLANLRWFIQQTRARKYYLTSNWRSTQTILDATYSFLSRRVPTLRSGGMLKRLASRTGGPESTLVHTADLERALWFVKQLLTSNPQLTQGDVAILSRKLDRKTLEEIERKAKRHGLAPQFHSSRADRALERTIGSVPSWEPGSALEKLYKQAKVREILASSLRNRNFAPLRDLRPLATAAEAIDSSLSPASLTFREAWPALKKTQDREVGVTAAVQPRRDAVQVMTIHAAKGLEFPVVLLMKLGKSFPSRESDEEARLAYVGATRAKDVLVLVHTTKKPKEILADFGKRVVPIRQSRKLQPTGTVRAPAILPTPPIVAATELDLYEECPLKFAAFHEGRYLPRWSVAQSIGSRMHKALEYLLRSNGEARNGTLQDLFKAGLLHGDSPLRRLPRKSRKLMWRAFRRFSEDLHIGESKAVLVEHRYRYMQGHSGQIEGVIDALIERPDGTLVLREWKTASSIAAARSRQYELQTRAAALGVIGQEGYAVQAVEVVPVLHPQRTVSLRVNPAFIQESQQMMEKVFKDVRDRNYVPNRGKHCVSCQLKPYCPAWKK